MEKGTVLCRELTYTLKQPGIKFGVKKAYSQTFSRLREALQKAQTTSGEIHSMLMASFKQLNADFGFSLQAPNEPDLVRFENDLNLIERSHLQYLGVSNVLKLSQSDFSERLVRALGTRLRVVYESALGEVELWNKSAASQLDAQLRERRRNFGRRIEAIERIQSAASGLDRKLKVNTVSRRTHSLFWQGTFWYRQLATMRDDWFESLINAYDKIVRAHGEFAETLGIL